MDGERHSIPDVWAGHRRRPWKFDEKIDGDPYCVRVGTRRMGLGTDAIGCSTRTRSDAVLEMTIRPSEDVVDEVVERAVSVEGSVGSLADRGDQATLSVGYRSGCCHVTVQPPRIWVKIYAQRVVGCWEIESFQSFPSLGRCR